MTKVAVVIPTLANEETLPYLKLCVESLRATTDWDIVVVSNGTKDKPNLSHIKGITLHLHTRDQGQCNATNIGVAATNPATDYILISNDDMYYAPDWSRHLRFDDVCFSPNLVEPTNNRGSAKPFVKFSGGYDLSEFKRREVDGFIAGLLDAFTISDKPRKEDGFNFPLFIQRKFWNFLGGYDLAYDPWGSNSDTDLQTRINLAGVIPIRLRDVLVYHFSNKSGTFDGTHQDFYQNNIEYFYDKFGFDRDGLGSDVWYNKKMIPEDADYIKYSQRKYDQN